MCFKAVEFLSKASQLRQVLIRDPEIIKKFDPFEN